MKTSKRKTRSDKFPLTLHPTGQYCKKIKGKIYYFGSNKKMALQKYLDEATHLHGCQEDIQKSTDDNMTLKQLCDIYLKYQFSKVQADNLTAGHHNEQISSLNKLITFLGQSRKIKNIATLDLQNYKRTLQKSHISVYRLNLHISIMKAMFHWARKNDILDNIPNIDAISRGKIVHKEKFTFNSKQITQLLLQYQRRNALTSLSHYMRPSSFRTGRSSSAKIANALQKNSSISLTRFMPQVTLPMNSKMSVLFD